MPAKEKMKFPRTMKGATLQCLALLVGLAGCLSAGVLPSYLSGYGEHPAYPRSSYITAAGRSAEGVRAAELDAKARVAEQVRSEIESITIMTMEEGGSEWAVDICSRIRTSATFGHAEMIRLDPNACVSDGGFHYAFAYLSRAEISRVLSVQYTAQSRSFRENAGALAGLEQALPAYTAAYRQARGAFAGLTAAAFEIRAVTGRVFRPYDLDAGVYADMERARTGLLRRTEISVDIAGDPPTGVREAVAVALTTALALLGPGVTIAPCGPGRITLEVDAVVDCARGRFGPTCTLGLTGVLVDCNSGGVLAALDLNDPGFRGAHSREAGRALDELRARVTAEALAGKLRAALEPVLPLS